MRLTLLLSFTTFALPAFSAPLEAKRQPGAPDAATITRLAPNLGFTAGLNPTGTGDCDGAVNGTDGKPIKVPCACPPAPDVYIPALIKNVQAGFAVNNPSVKVSFPTGDSKQDKSTRISAASITIQNLNGPGKGCPFASTKLGALQKAVNNGTDVTPPANPPANSTVTPTSTPVSSTPANSTVTPTSTPVKSTPANSTVTPTSTPVNSTPANSTVTPTSTPVKSTPANSSVTPTSTPVSSTPANSTVTPTSTPVSSTPANSTVTPTSTPVSSTPANSTVTSTPVKSTPASNTVTPSSTTPVNSTPTNGTPDAATITRLAPELGFKSGVNPTGTGDCDGAINGKDGKPIKIPCACPPAQDVYLDALVKNVQAGKAVNNPSVKISFPTDNSKQSESTRITAALITLQNLNGSGKGCPAASTTLVARQKALAS